MQCFFTSDLHGSVPRYRGLLRAIEDELPEAVLIGGDLFSIHGSPAELLSEVFCPGLRRIALRAERAGRPTPRVLVILGNDDPRALEPLVLEAEADGLLEYVHLKTVPLGPYTLCGYSYVPPTPFLLKDWERYDVSRYVDPGCVSPEEGRLSVPVEARIVRHATIAQDLEELTQGLDPHRTLLLFHSPPYATKLDRAALDGRKIDHVPVDVHVGSIAIKRLIERWHPRLTLHGHIHESPRLTGAWRETLGETVALCGCHDGPELALVRFDPERPGEATRELIGQID